MKREVAAKQTFAGNFRGVCPISNRATATAEQTEQFRSFFLKSRETPGSVRKRMTVSLYRTGVSGQITDLRDVIFSEIPILYRE